MDAALGVGLFLATVAFPRLCPSPSPQDTLSTQSVLENLRDEQRDVPFYKFVLTGGPCGGKTTALARVSSFCE